MPYPEMSKQTKIIMGATGAVFAVAMILFNGQFYMITAEIGSEKLLNALKLHFAKQDKSTLEMAESVCSTIANTGMLAYAGTRLPNTLWVELRNTCRYKNYHPKGKINADEDETSTTPTCTKRVGRAGKVSFASLCACIFGGLALKNGIIFGISSLSINLFFGGEVLRRLFDEALKPFAKTEYSTKRKVANGALLVATFGTLGTASFCTYLLMGSQALEGTPISSLSMVSGLLLAIYGLASRATGNYLFLIDNIIDPLTKLCSAKKPEQLENAQPEKDEESETAPLITQPELKKRDYPILAFLPFLIVFVFAGFSAGAFMASANATQAEADKEGIPTIKSFPLAIDGELIFGLVAALNLETVLSFLVNNRRTPLVLDRVEKISAKVISRLSCGYFKPVSDEEDATPVSEVIIENKEKGSAADIASQDNDDKQAVCGCTIT
jgi:hypothetical protein